MCRIVLDGPRSSTVPRAQPKRAAKSFSFVIPGRLEPRLRGKNVRGICSSNSKGLSSEKTASTVLELQDAFALIAVY